MRKASLKAKVVSTLLVASMLAAMLSGCGSKTESNPAAAILCARGVRYAEPGRRT